MKIPDELSFQQLQTSIEIGVIGLSAAHYKFYCQDVENVIRFKDNLVFYPPIKEGDEIQRLMPT